MSFAHFIFSSAPHVCLSIHLRRQLSHTPRIRLHKHLFACLLLYAILSSLLKLHLLDTETSAALEDAGQPPDIGDQNTSAHYCLGLTMALRYFRSATYLWMFNEAFYLHQLIKKAFTSPPVNPLIALAYGLPLLMTIAYCVCRSLLLPVEEQSLHSLNATLDALPQPSLSFEGQTDVCWLVPARDPWTEWVINGPNLAILLVSGANAKRGRKTRAHCICVKLWQTARFLARQPQPDSQSSLNAHFRFDCRSISRCSCPS